MTWLRKLMVGTLVGLIPLVDSCSQMPIPIISSPQVREKTSKCSFEVNSTPSGANIYINDRLLGQTNSTVSYPIHYRVSRALLDQESTNSIIGEYYLKVQKQGYKEDGTMLTFTISQYGDSIKVNDTHFTLEKIE